MTAVEWLVNRVYMVIPDSERNFLEGLRKEGLEKEKEQIIDAYEAAMERPIENYAESYYNMNYNQTYNQKEETLEEWKSKFTHHCAVKNNQKQHIIDITKADEDDGLYDQNK